MKLLVITTFFALLNYATCFDCYECQNCEIPFNSQTNTATCSSSVTQCMKITAKLGTVYTYVLKQCGPCSNETFAFGVTYLHVDCCTGSTCNRTNTISMSKFSITACLLVFFYYYLFRILYINFIYKRKRPWCEITTQIDDKSIKQIDENINSVLSRQSMSPLIQEYLPCELRKQPMKRKMTTRLEFSEPPLFRDTFKEDWDELDTQSLDSRTSVSTETSFYTVGEETFCERSLTQYLSLTSSSNLTQSSPSIEQLSPMDTCSTQTPLQICFKPFTTLSRQLVNNEKYRSDINNASNYIVINMDNSKEINIFNNVSHV
ncbi:unnamed protein product [Rotaria magnacalcarata]|uniref:UPAR/Ly6 domain-containing protein n=1 Tax=Rotaria magnacalcarata TaxID=392030 RepID=A0A816E4S3_9BILA|nr:unnamed protein product [Rotaria magnacalcarata]CAF1905672.1 unnamed protein product [Rotaria magnacalcarata]CAF3875017.1 unnamed protein product [Rotaria magnacalcarata]CAF3995324.1 unnamed protein product [Rotaria magnacalcarata]